MFMNLIKKGKMDKKNKLEKGKRNEKKARHGLAQHKTIRMKRTTICFNKKKPGLSQKKNPLKTCHTELAQEARASWECMSC